MKTGNPNRGTAAAGAEAPHQSVQSAKREEAARRAAALIGGPAEFQARTAAQIALVMSAFGARSVEVRP